MENQFLDVYREFKGTYQLVGYLEGDPASARFCYASEYLDRSDAKAVSTRLPLGVLPFDESRTRAFFEALLPEGDARSALDQERKIPSGQYLKTLSGLGDETVGALVIEQPGSMPGSLEQYEPIDDTFFDDFSIMPDAMARRANGRMRLSIAGAMAKIGLYHDPDDGTWCFPLGSAPSTHVIKAPANAFPGQAFNEAICMRAAGLLGLEVAKTDLLRCPSTERVLLVSQRFDRPFDGSAVVGSRKRPVRLHQEDFCQLLGYMGTSKYDEEIDEDRYLGAAGRELGIVAQVASRERLRLFESVTTDVLLGNCDAHLKNYAVLYDAGWDYARLAPLYDIVSTTAWMSLDATLALSFNAKSSLSEIRQSDLAHLATTLGAGKKCMEWLERAHEIAVGICGALEEARDTFVASGFPEARAAADTILEQTQNRVKTIWMEP